MSFDWKSLHLLQYFRVAGGLFDILKDFLRLFVDEANIILTKTNEKTYKIDTNFLKNKIAVL